MREGVTVFCVVLLLTGCAGLEPHRGSKVLRQQSASEWDGRTEGRRNTPGKTRQPPGTSETQRALRETLEETSDTLRQLEAALARHQANAKRSFSGIFTRDVEHGARQVRWLRSALQNATSLVDTAEALEDPEMRRELFRMSGPSLQSALSGTALLATWVDFLKLADVVREECPYYGAEQLFVDMDRVWKRMEPSMDALATMDPEPVEATTAAMPGLMAQLSREFQSIQGGARSAMEQAGKVAAAAQFLEMLTLASALKATLPRPPPATPVTVGMGLVMGSGGVMTGTRIVVTAEWVERMRQLVQAGVISAPAAGAAVRLYAQAKQDLPKGVREALGDSPEVRAMYETGRGGAGMSSAPRHHVLPQEHREWFEQRGFKGAMDIDHFCVRLEQAHHEAIHGGGDWRLGRTWPREWNRLVMTELQKAETRFKRLLTRNEVLEIVAELMKIHDIPMKFSSGRRR
jgi:hypothetical protein